MVKQQKHPIFHRNSAGTQDDDSLTELLFEGVIRFGILVEINGEIVDNHSEDSSELSGEAAWIGDLIRKGANPGVVLSRLAVRKSDAAHLSANMIRRQAGLPTRPLRDLVLASLEHGKLSPALCRSETIYLQRAGLLDEKQGGLSEKGVGLYETDQAVMDAHQGQRTFRKPKTQTLVRNAWMKLCPI